MKGITGNDICLRDLLSNKKFVIEYYQREYRWESKHIKEMIEDLTGEFLEYYRPGQEREEVENYGKYFLGSIVIAAGDAIIDGQQRLTSLTLLLIYLVHRLKAIGADRSDLRPMIFSQAYGKKSFNLQVEERQGYMQALYEGNIKGFDLDHSPDSVRTMAERYDDILGSFPSDDVDNKALPYFCDWLIQKVVFIRIDAETEQDAHEIFVSMNDRGLSLTSTEMLKGYLLSEIHDTQKRLELERLWKDTVQILRSPENGGDKGGDETFIKAWLRAQYADSIREKKADAVPGDFDLAGTAFHKWVRDEHVRLGLGNAAGYEDFLRRFAWFARQWQVIKKAEREFRSETAYVFYNAQLDFTLQPLVLLSVLCYGDEDSLAREKINLAARFLDLYIVSRATRQKSLDYHTVLYYVFELVKDIRRCDLAALKGRLKDKWTQLAFNPTESVGLLQLNGYTKKYIKHILARITGFLEEQSGIGSNYLKYIDRKIKDPYEIEHIITDHYEWFSEEYTSREDFDTWRNKLGDLLLLRRSINASLQDKLYKEKLPKYTSTDGNVLAATLCKAGYENAPRLNSFISENNLQCEPYDGFGKTEIGKRNYLLVQLYALVWNAEMFK